MHSLRSAFAFASPRYAPFQTLFDLHAPFQYINQGDLVPNVPPRLFGYDDFLYEFTLDGWPYIAPDRATLCKYVYWLGFLASSRFLKNHSILTYRDGIKGALNSAQRSRLGRNDQHSLFPVPQSILVNHVACRLRSSVRSIRSGRPNQLATFGV